jgi:integration host factor subunit alpha
MFIVLRFDKSIVYHCLCHIIFYINVEIDRYIYYKKDTTEINVTLSKAKLVEQLSHKNFSYNKNTLYDMVCDFIDLMEESLIEDGSLKLSGFGNFTVVDKGARVGRNPQTSKELIISRRKVVTFHSSTKLKHIINTKFPISNFPNEKEDSKNQVSDGVSVQKLEPNSKETDI